MARTKQKHKRLRRGGKNTQNYTKKPEWWRTDAFELCWRRLLRVPWTARRSNQSILKEIKSDYLLEGLMLKLKLQYSGLLMWRADSWKRPCCRARSRAGGEGGNGGWDGCMASSTHWTCVWANSEILKDREAWRAVIYRITKSQTQLSDWIMNEDIIKIFIL